MSAIVIQAWISSWSNPTMSAAMRAGSGPPHPFTAPFNVSGNPAISFPLGHSREGLPIGVQLAAATGREDILLRVAAQLEQATPWHHRHPATHVGG